MHPLQTEIGRNQRFVTGGDLQNGAVISDACDYGSPSAGSGPDTRDQRLFGERHDGPTIKEGTPGSAKSVGRRQPWRKVGQLVPAPNSSLIFIYQSPPACRLLRADSCPKGSFSLPVWSLSCRGLAVTRRGTAASPVFRNPGVVPLGVDRRNLLCYRCEATSKHSGRAKCRMPLGLQAQRISGLTLVLVVRSDLPSLSPR